MYRMSNPLFKKKPMDMLLREAADTGEHTLKRTLGPLSLTALGVGAVIGAGIFVMTGLGATYAGPALTISFIVSGFGCVLAGLCYAEFAAMIPLAGSAYTYAYAALGELLAWIIGWDLTLEYAMGASTVSSGWSNHFVELLQIFRLKMPLWLAYDHWTALATAENMLARAQVHAANPSLSITTKAFSDRVHALIDVPSPDLLRQAHDLVAAPRIFGFDFGFNLPAFVIALIITAVLVIGIKESANFNATIVVIKVGVVLFVILLGLKYVDSTNIGHSWAEFAPMGVGGIWKAAAYIFFAYIGFDADVREEYVGGGFPYAAYIGFDAVSTTAQEAKNPQRDLPIGIIASLVACTILYILVAFVLTGMVPWRSINIEAPLAVAFLDHGLNTASTVITAGALAGLTSVMLVMLLGQTRVLYAMANDGLLPRKFFAAIHPKFRTPYKTTILVGLLAA